MDRLIEAIEAKQNPSVVGLDPTEALVPANVPALPRKSANRFEDPAGSAGHAAFRGFLRIQSRHY